MGKIEIQNVNIHGEDEELLGRNYDGLSEEEQKYVDDTINIIDTYFEKRDRKIVNKSKLYIRLKEVKFYSFDDKLKSIGIAGYCEDGSIHLDKGQSPTENDITIHEMSHLFIDIRKFLGRFFNEGLVDIVSKNIAKENGIKTVASYHLNRAITSMLMGVLGEDNLIKIGSMGCFQPEYNEIFYALKVYGDSLILIIEDNEPGFKETLEEIISIIGELFHQIYTGYSDSEKEQAQESCINYVKNFMDRNLDEVKEGEKDYFLKVFSENIIGNKTLA